MAHPSPSAPHRHRPPSARADVERARRTRPARRDTDRSQAHDQADREVWLLHVRYERTRAPQDLAALVEEYTGYALSIAHRMYRHGEPKEDLEQVAMEALVASLQRFTVDRGIPFPAFATPTVAGAVKRHYRDRGWAIRAPRRAHDLAGPIRAAREDLAGSLGRSPTPVEVAEEVGVSAEVVTEVDVAVRARSLASLDTPFHPDGRSLGDTIGDDDPLVDLTTDRIDLADALEVLSDREREVLSLYFCDELSQREIAARYGVSQMQVSRWLRSTLGRLRSRMVVPA